LLGTWKNTRTYNDNGSTETDNIQYTFNADGTFIEIHDEVYSDNQDKPKYFNFKGTYSVDAEGNVTFTYTECTRSTDGVTWTPVGHSNTYIWPALVIGNQLYLDLDSFFIAQGTVSGIVGTWAIKGINKTWNNGTQGYDQTYRKDEIIFNNDGTTIDNNYDSSDGTFGLPSFTTTYTYTYSNGTFTWTVNGTTYSAKVAIYNNKYLIFGDETSVTASAYIKQ